MALLRITAILLKSRAISDAPAHSRDSAKVQGHAQHAAGLRKLRIESDPFESEPFNGLCQLRIESDPFNGLYKLRIESDPFESEPFNGLCQFRIESEPFNGLYKL